MCLFLDSIASRIFMIVDCERSPYDSSSFSNSTPVNHFPLSYKQYCGHRYLYDHSFSVSAAIFFDSLFLIGNILDQPDASLIIVMQKNLTITVFVSMMSLFFNLLDH